MTHDELQTIIIDVERDINRIFNNVPNFAKVAMPELVREAEAVIHALVKLRTRLMLEGVHGGQAKESEYWGDQLPDLPATQRGAQER